MEIVSSDVLPATALVWRPNPATWVYTVVSKATFTLLPGVSVLAGEQEPINEEDTHWDDDPGKSMHCPRDVVPFMSAANVVLVGHAFAPEGKPARSLVARMKVGSIDKAIEVVADRAFGVDGTLREGAPFLKMPLRYERAAAGPGNPVGIRPDAPPNARGLIPLPNLQPPGTRINQRGDWIPTVGFGPIAESWPERAQRLPYGVIWHRGSWSSEPKPEAWDPTYFNPAPPDQMLYEMGGLRADEAIRLEHLHRSHAALETRLPGDKPTATAYPDGESPREVPLNADLMWIDTDRGVCTVTWRGQLRLRSRDQAGRVIFTIDQGSRRRSRPDIQFASDPRETSNISHLWLMDEPVPEGTVVAGYAPAPSARSASQPTGSEKAADMPFMMPSPGAPPPPAAIPSSDDGPRVPADAGETQTLFQGEGALAAVMPFLAKRSPQPAKAPPPSEPAMTPPQPPPLQAPPPIVQAQSAVMTPAPPAPPAPPVARPPMIPMPAPASSSAEAPVSASSLPGGRVPQAAGAEDPARPKIISLSALKPSGPPRSALAASNAASDARALPQPSAPQPAPARKVALIGAAPANVVELVWLDPAVLSILKRHPDWTTVLSEKSAAPTDKYREGSDKDDVLTVLTQAAPGTADGIGAALLSAIDEHGAFRPPNLLLSGDIDLPFDALETLKATMAAVSPYVGEDKKLKETVDSINELLRTPWLSSASGITENLTDQLRDTFSRGGRSLPPRYLESHTERILLEQRHYQRRSVLGQQPCIRSLFTPAGSSTPIPSYLPSHVGRELPMFQRFQVRVIAEVRIQLDQHESHPHALRLLALGRVLKNPVRRPHMG